MPTIKTIIEDQQPKVYEQLMAICRDAKSPEKSSSISTWFIEKFMMHDSYRRGRGGVRQVGRGWTESVRKC